MENRDWWQFDRVNGVRAKTLPACSKMGPSTFPLIPVRHRFHGQCILVQGDGGLFWVGIFGR